ncbi:MAG: glycosyltransferase family 4 protein [Lentisphaerae bacterium]|nr:glycosyltransferase family 4 protein [Lentisphaerota bacterium]
MAMSTRLAIDALPLLLEGGISHYVRPLVEHVAAAAGLRSTSALPDWSLDLVFRLGGFGARRALYEAYCRTAPPARGRHRLIPWPDRVVQWCWTHGLAVPGAGRPGQPGVFLATTELVPLGHTSRRRVVGIVYDLIPLRLPRYFKENTGVYQRQALARVNRCDALIAISECTRRDVTALLGVPEERIRVIYPGADAPSPTALVEPPEPAPARPYIYYAGALALNKNVDGLLRIFARVVHDHGLDLELILSGRDFCGIAFWRRMTDDLCITDRVRLLGWRPAGERDWWLTHALMLWQFSWYEGFGLPVLEAAARGVPVLCSNRGALPEILKHPEQELDPGDEAAAAARAAAACRSPATLAAWRAHGLRRAAAFDWSVSARQLLACCAEVAAESTRESRAV